MAVAMMETHGGEKVSPDGKQGREGWARLAALRTTPFGELGQGPMRVTLIPSEAGPFGDAQSPQQASLSPPAPLGTKLPALKRLETNHTQSLAKEKELW